MKDRYLRVFEKVEVTCRDVEKLLGDYCDAELPAALKTRMDEKIQSCEHCHELLASYQQVISLAKEIKQQEQPIPQEVSQRLRAKLSERLNIAL